MGFKTEQFVEEVDENLICGICLDVLEDPWQCRHGHVFCKDCITRCLQTNQTCPECKNVLQIESLGRCLRMKNFIENLNVYCQPPEIDEEESKLECDWTGKLQLLAKHREICPFQQVQCPNVNCNTNLQRRELEDHDKICGYKKVECEKCREVLVRRALSIHKDFDCPEELDPCPYSCRGQDPDNVNKIRRIDLGNHMRNECAKTILDCPFKDQGCSVQVERQHVEKHVQDNMVTHMILLAKQCSSLTKQNSSLTEQNTKLTDQCTKLVKDNKQLKKELNHVKQNEELSRTYRWKIKDYRNLRRRSCIRSPTFWLCGYSWYLELQLKDQISVYLYLDKGSGSNSSNVKPLHIVDVPVSCRLAVTSPISGFSDLSSEKLRVGSSDLGFKWEGFMTEDDGTYCDEDGSLIVKCTIQVDPERKK